MLKKKLANHRSIKMMKGKKGGFVEGHNENIGKGEHANMPKEVIMKPYSKSAGMGEYDIDDTMSDIDYLQSKAESKRRKNMSYQK
jgi:hypothetical protein